MLKKAQLRTSGTKSVSMSMVVMLNFDRCIHRSICQLYLRCCRSRRLSPMSLELRGNQGSIKEYQLPCRPASQGDEWEANEKREERKPQLFFSTAFSISFECTGRTGYSGMTRAVHRNRLFVGSPLLFAEVTRQWMAQDSSRKSGYCRVHKAECCLRDLGWCSILLMGLIMLRLHDPHFWIPSMKLQVV